ncbi:MAG: class I SAM-dependent methyltransferase [Balneolaceae bacterium]
MKDNFSAQSELYAKYRPVFPTELFDDLVKLSPGKKLAWDCGTGNGQAANVLAPHFEQVTATDISEQQLQHAVRANNITYKKEPAESTSLTDDSVDLITVAQAVHWFDFDKFYKEVNRVLKEDGILALLSYGLFKTNSEMDEPIQEFYHELVGPFWDEEREYIDEEYKTIPFPFSEIELGDYKIVKHWTFEEMIGYIESWSAVQHYKSAKKENPITWIENRLKPLWPASQKVQTISDVILRVGKK